MKTTSEISSKAETAGDPYRVEATSSSDLDGSAATELTGMIPFLPETPAEIEAYQSLMPYSADSLIRKPSDDKTPDQRRKGPHM